MVSHSLLVMIHRSAAVVVLALVLAGCAVESPETADRATATAATPTATPSATEPPALATVFISPNGLGPLTIGSAAPTVPAPTDMIVFNATACADSTTGEDWGVADDDPAAARWQPNYPDEPFGVYVNDGRVHSLQFFRSTLTTEEGIGGESSRAEVLAAYPEITVDTSVQTFASDVYVLPGDVGMLVIEVRRQPAGQSYWESADIDRVLVLTVQPLGAQPFAIAGTDAIFNSCL